MQKYDCCVCEESFQFGPNVYSGRKVLVWCGLMICHVYERSNGDGIVPAMHPNLMARLQSLGKVILNENGWIVVPGVRSD